MRETLSNRKMCPLYFKDNRLSFQGLYFKSLISFIVIVLSRYKDKRFFGMGVEK